jgi:hypothetical protein
MENNYNEKINLIGNLLVSSDVINGIVKNINKNDIERYILDIGSILYECGKTINGYTFFPYDVYIKRGTYNEFAFKIALTFGAEEESINYRSKYETKDPIKIKKGVILLGFGKFNETKSNIELSKNDIDFMIWNTTVNLQILKDEVQWEPYLKPYSNDTPNIVNKIYDKYPTYFETHHIDNHPENTCSGNIVKVTREQHASIHLWMWNNYKLEDNFLKGDYQENN